MPIKPSDQEEFNEQISGFFRREPSPGEAKRKLASHSAEMMKSLPDMLEMLQEYPTYAAVAFHGKFEWIDRRSITNLAARNAPAAQALKEIRAKKALRLAASAKPGWDSLLAAAPDALWIAIQINLAGWKMPMSGPADDDLIETDEENHSDEDQENDDEH